jgi:4-hydroxybenzoate polyprenyltransferase
MREALEFMRLEVCLFFVLPMTMAGYFLFNATIVGEATRVALMAILAGIAVYSYNNTSDTAEDLINKKKVNAYALNWQGKAIPAIAFLAGVVVSASLSVFSLLFFSTGVLLSWVYSSAKVKRYFLIKNIYTSLGFCLVFLAGAAAEGRIDVMALPAYFFFSFIAFIASFISDWRDIVGDAAIGAHTMPVVLGEKAARATAHWLVVLSTALTFAMNTAGLLAGLPALLAADFFVFAQRPKASHASLGLFFILIMLSLAVL